MVGGFVRRIAARALLGVAALVIAWGLVAPLTHPAWGGPAEGAAHLARLSAAQSAARPKGYWDKNHLYHVLDALILSSPITGLIALVLFLDPDVRQRPPGIFRDNPEGLEISSRYRRRLMMKLGGAIACVTLSGLGALTYFFHLLDLIPRL
jgi:hypothetical protein